MKKFNWGTGIVLAFIGFIFSEQFITWMGAEAQIIGDATGYRQERRYQRVDLIVYE